ncbi:unnamed protein product [Amoebophrya sp. A120]|nr:unnamed protein product [Amoebophrya sp. A120]|eukprot:GSA120T00012894001.1
MCLRRGIQHAKSSTEVSLYEACLHMLAGQQDSATSRDSEVVTVSHETSNSRSRTLASRTSAGSTTEQETVEVHGITVVEEKNKDPSSVGGEVAGVNNKLVAAPRGTHTDKISAEQAAQGRKTLTFPQPKALPATLDDCLRPLMEEGTRHLAYVRALMQQKVRRMLFVVEKYQWRRFLAKLRAARRRHHRQLTRFHGFAPDQGPLLESILLAGASGIRTLFPKSFFERFFSSTGTTKKIGDQRFFLVLRKYINIPSSFDSSREMRLGPSASEEVTTSVLALYTSRDAYFRGTQQNPFDHVVAEHLNSHGTTSLRERRSGASALTTMKNALYNTVMSRGRGRASLISNLPTDGDKNAGTDGAVVIVDLRNILGFIYGPACFPNFSRCILQRIATNAITIVYRRGSGPESTTQMSSADWHPASARGEQNAAKKSHGPQSESTNQRKYLSLVFQDFDQLYHWVTGLQMNATLRGYAPHCVTIPPGKILWLRVLYSLRQKLNRPHFSFAKCVNGMWSQVRLDPSYAATRISRQRTGGLSGLMGATSSVSLLG